MRLSQALMSALPRLVGALLATAIAAPALAGPVALRDNPTDVTGQVTLGELFDNAGAAANVLVAVRAGPTVVLDAANVQMFARRYGLDWANPQGISRIIVRGGTGGAPASGPHNANVLTYAHNLSAGDIVQPTDVVWQKAAAAPSDAPRDADAVIGMAARRPLREGDAVQAHDVSAPIVVKMGDSVIVTYSADGVTLTLQAKAMGAAAAGETFNVLNTASKKLIEAVATGPDTAVVGPEAQRLKAAHDPALIASR